MSSKNQALKEDVTLIGSTDGKVSKKSVHQKHTKSTLETSIIQSRKLADTKTSKKGSTSQMRKILKPSRKNKKRKPTSIAYLSPKKCNSSKDFISASTPKKSKVCSPKKSYPQPSSANPVLLNLPSNHSKTILKKRSKLVTQSKSHEKSKIQVASSSEPSSAETKKVCSMIQPLLSPNETNNSDKNINKFHTSSDPLNSSSDSSMEVDYDGNYDRSNIGGCHNLLGIVVDTNIFISGTSLLNNIKNKTLNDLKLVIVIPYAVIQELDNLKQSKPVAQKAIRWCNEHLETGNSYVQGQSFEDYLEAALLYGGTDADDKIRDCCLFYKKKGFSICLLSDDVNLRNKAILSGVQVIDSATLKTHLISGSITLNNDKMAYKTETSKPTPSIKENKSSVTNELKMLEESLRQTLNPIIEDAMQESYGDLWVKIVVYPPPWDAKDALLCIDRHWIAVFMDKFSNVVQDCVKELINLLSKDFESENSIKKLEKQISYLFKMFEKTKYKSFIKFVSSNDTTASNIPGNSNDDCKMSHFQNVIFTLGINASRISHSLIQEVETSGISSELSTSLENLKNSLTTLGSTLIKLLNEPSLESLKSINEELQNYWNCAKDSASYRCLQLEDLNCLVRDDKCKALLLSCTDEFEKIINKIYSLRPS